MIIKIKSMYSEPRKKWANAVLVYNYFSKVSSAGRSTP
jgi:hypothetical protein